MVAAVLWMEIGPGLPGRLFVFLYKIPVSDIFNTIHPDAIDPEIVHPTDDGCLHQLPGGIAICPEAGYRIIAVFWRCVAKERAAKSIAYIGGTGSPGIMGIGIGGRRGRVDDKEIPWRCGQIR